MQQGRLDDQLAALERAAPTPVERRVMRRGRPTCAGARAPRRWRWRAARSRATRSAGCARPSAGLSAVVVEGNGAGELRRGPGHYPATALPGQRGTVAIAGHRTTYGAPFRHLDDLERGDRIELAMPYGRFTYRVEAQPHRGARARRGSPAGWRTIGWC